MALEQARLNEELAKRDADRADYSAQEKAKVQKNRKGGDLDK